MEPDSYHVAPLDQPPDANVTVPGSKSYTNRALVAAALARGRSTLTGALASDDTAAMIDCLGSLGIDVAWSEDGTLLEVSGCDGRLPRSSAELQCRASGTTARFVTPLACLGDGPYRIDGSPQLRTRPMVDLLTALRTLGAKIEESPGGPDRLPVTLTRQSFRGGDIALTGNVSSQFLSGLLLSAPYYPEGIDVTITTELVSRSYVDLTLQTVTDFGGDVAIADQNRFCVRFSGYLARTYAVEPDASAASYFLAAAAVTGGRVRVNGLHRTSRQGDIAFADILMRMGCTVADDGKGVEVVGPKQLQGIELDMSNCSDVAQTLAAIAPFASSPTRITGIGFIRRKETDRIGAMVTELQRCGVDATEEPDGLIIRPGLPHAATVNTYGDHRMAMSMALIGLRVPGLVIREPGCVAKTFPGYWDALESLRR